MEAAFLPLDLETFTIREAADYAKLGYDAMKDLIDRGDVPAASCNQKHTVVLREDLKEYLRDLARTQAAERRKNATGSSEPARRGRSRRQLPSLPVLSG